MPPFALVVVLIAALLHALWNLLAKDAVDSSAFMWWGVAVGATWYGAWVFTQSWPGIPREIWLLLAVSIFMEVAYVALITRGYAAGDLSQVYPIARGAPPLLIALFSGIFLGERLPLIGYVGIVVLVVGVYLASLSSFAELWKPLRALSQRAPQWAWLAALTVAAYSTIDKVGVNFASPLMYNAWIYTGIAVGYAPVVWSRPNRASTIREFRTNWRRIAIGSVTTIGSYLLALVGMSMTAASYVSAVRATSVVIGALFGWILLKENLGGMRVFAAAIMVVGLILVAWA